MAKDAKDRIWVGFDLGGSKMLAVVFNDDMKVIARERKRTRAHEGAQAGIARICDTIRTALRKADVSTKAVSGIGVGCPGPLDLDEGFLIEAPNLGWKNLPLRAELEDEFKCPVTVLNDVDAGVYGEYRFGAGRDGRCVLGVFPGTGIGGGCVYEGRILRGRKNSCMEIGHVQVLPDGPLCGCGLRGCLEAVASRLAIAAAAAKAAHRGDAPHLQDAEGTDVSEIRSGALARSVAAGDETIEQIVRTAAGYIGVAVATAVHLLAPDIVVLGGGLVEAMPELFVETVTHASAGRVMPTFVGTFRVVVAELGDDSTAMGAAAWGRAVGMRAPDVVSAG